ncbi:hypothetical protein O3M35_007940 [Rhynocoris fuscipes]|uniref:MANSC domain-containing protein n=1 Tax=Rhynocoris fuscipes TaxID=488301 RepID=A0AAW1DCK9_9HEMI
MRNKYICYGTLLLLCQFNYLVLVKTNNHKVSEHAEEKHVVRRHENHLQICLENFDILQDKIIRTQDSKDMGAKYITEKDVPTRGDCLRLCCETDNCDVFVYEEKNPGGCYLFECGTPEDFKCKFTKHHNYTSAVLTVNRHLSELETQIKFTQHEHELTKLREPESKPNISSLQIKSTSSPKNKEYLQYGVEPPPIHIQRKGCSRNQFECHSDGECIAIYNACDGIAQCADGSDEGPELQCPGSQVSTGSPKIEVETVVTATSNEGLKESYNIPVNSNRETLVNPVPVPVQKQWIPHQKYPEAEESSQSIKNDFAQKPMMIANQGGNMANPRANYGREGEGVNYHPEQPQQPQWNNYQYHPNSGSSQIFTHKGNGLIPQSERFMQHPRVSQDVPIRKNSQQYSDQAPYYYENVPYRMYPQNPPNPNQWQQPGQQHETAGTMVEEGNMNHNMEPSSMNNAPDYYYEEPYRNRGPPPPPPPYQQQPYPNHIRPPYHNKEQNVEFHESRNDNQSNNVEKHIVTTIAPTKPSKVNVKDNNNNNVQHSHRKIDKFQAEAKLKETFVEQEIDGHNASPSGAILSLTLGLCLTAFMVIIVGCRMKMVHRRLRRGGKGSYAHEADFLVNGMYL